MSRDSGAARARSFDLIVRNVYLEEGAGSVDLAVVAGRIVAIESRLAGNGAEELDGQGCLASPPFIDPHTHLDKAFLQPLPNRSGTLNEAIAIMQDHKGEIVAPSFAERVDRAISWAVQNGTLAIRSHVDVDVATKAASIEAMLVAKQRWAGVVDLQVVAFPQEGLMGNEDNQTHLRRALALGADLVGGIPAAEASERMAREHIDFVFELAAEYDADIDMHIDETDDPRSRTLEMLADATLKADWHGRVTAVHCCALAAYDDVYAAHVIEKVAEAQLHVVTNPPINLVLQGRHDRHPIRRGVTRVKELLAAGVNVTCGQDNMRDVFYPFGQADMLEVAFVTALAAHMTGQDEIETVFDMPRRRAAEVLGIREYGVREGGPADLVLLPAASAADALASRPPRLAVLRDGRLVCQTKQHVDRWLHLNPD